MKMTEDSCSISLHENSCSISLRESSVLNEWWRTISNDGLTLLGYFEARTAAELSNGTKLNGMQVSVTFSDKRLEFGGIGTIELVDVEPDNIAANADVYLQKPYFDELWSEVRQYVPTDYALIIEVAPVVRTKDGFMWDISEN